MAVSNVISLKNDKKHIKWAAKGAKIQVIYYTVFINSVTSSMHNVTVNNHKRIRYLTLKELFLRSKVGVFKYTPHYQIFPRIYTNERISSSSSSSSAKNGKSRYYLGLLFRIYFYRESSGNNYLSAISDHNMPEQQNYFHFRVARQVKRR